jgi:hypothetical protein
MKLSDEEKFIRDADILYNSGCCLHTVTTELLKHSSEYGESLNYNDVFVFIRSRVSHRDLSIDLRSERTVLDINSHFNPPPPPPPPPEPPKIVIPVETAHERRERLQQMKRKLAIDLQMELSNNYELACQLLSHFGIKQKPENQLLSKLKELFISPNTISRSRAESTINQANKFLLTLDKKLLKQYIIDRNLEVGNPIFGSSNFIFDYYFIRHMRNIRVTHCYRCKRHLKTSLANECDNCGWIKCRCGACGCKR